MSCLPMCRTCPILIIAVISVTVLEGAIRSQVISGNVSETEPARLLAVCVVNTDETKLTTPSGG
jgi:hypothetical protein